MNKFKRSKTLDTLHKLGVVGELSADERKAILRNYRALYPSFINDLEEMAGDAMESNDQEKIKDLSGEINATCKELTNFADDAVEILTELNEIAVILVKEQLKDGKKYEKGVSQLFTSMEDCRTFFDAEGASAMKCADWARRAYKYMTDKKLYLDYKGDKEILYNAIKKAHPNIAGVKVFRQKIKDLENEDIWKK